VPSRVAAVVQTGEGRAALTPSTLRKELTLTLTLTLMTSTRKPITTSSREKSSCNMMELILTLTLALTLTLTCSTRKELTLTGNSLRRLQVLSPSFLLPTPYSRRLPSREVRSPATRVLVSGGDHA